MDTTDAYADAAVDAANDATGQLYALLAIAASISELTKAVERRASWGSRHVAGSGCCVPLHGPTVHPDQCCTGACIP